MILLHRLTSFALAFLLTLGFAALIYLSEQTLAVMGALLVIVALLLARLLRWEVKRISFWIFLGTPVFFLLTAFLFYLLLEGDLAKVALGLVVILATWLYAENLFAFYHLPSTYQAYALEYLSLAIYVISGFFLTSGAYGLQLGLSLPIWIPTLAVFWTVLLATMGVFWVSKISKEIAMRFALTGAVLMTEFYIVFATLPTSFLTNAAAFAIFLYLYLGLTRAHVLEKLSKKVLQRYILISALLLIIVFSTTRWT